MRIQGDFGEKIVVAVGAVVLDKDDRVLLVKHVEAKREGSGSTDGFAQGENWSLARPWNKGS